jgi:hypothetical protein
MSIYIGCFSIFIYFSLLLVGHAYRIDDSCTGQNLQRVQEAAAEALNMYAYASFRIQQNNPRLDFSNGRVFEQLLGPNAKDRLARK